MLLRKCVLYLEDSVFWKMAEASKFETFYFISTKYHPCDITRELLSEMKLKITSYTSKIADRGITAGNSR